MSFVNMRNLERANSYIKEIVPFLFTYKQDFLGGLQNEIMIRH